MRKKVLLVDDDSSFLSLAKETLTQEGYEVLEASNGQEALRLLFVHKPDLVLLDVVMPRMDGWQTCSRIREMSDVPIVILTGQRKSEQDIVRGLDYGADDYLTKPIGNKEIVSRVRAILRRAERSHQGSDRQRVRHFAHPVGADTKSIVEIINAGENNRVEFKASLRWDHKLLQVNKALEITIIKTINGFLNTIGGTLLIGVDDSKHIIGIENDYKSLPKPDRDGYELHLTQLISNQIGKAQCLNTTISFHDIDGKDVCVVQVEPSPKPAYIKEGQESRFYIRTGNQTQPLSIKESVEYIQQHWQA